MIGIWFALDDSLNRRSRGKLPGGSENRDPMQSTGVSIMIRTRTLRRSAPWGLVFALSLAPLPAVAQDGQLPTGPKVTAPATNANETLTDQGAETVPRVISDVLTPVPATAADPAPPGTRAVRVDGPVTAEGVPIGAVPDRQRAGQPMGRGIRTAEGVVVGLSAPENLDESDARLIVTIDPTISWDEHYGPGNSGADTTPSTLGDAAAPAVQETRQAAEAAQEAAQQAAQAAKQAADAANNPRDVQAPSSSGPQERAASSVEPDQGEVDQANPSATQNPNRLTFVITKRTYIYAFARTAEGVDLYGASTVSSPDNANVRSDGVTGTPLVNPRPAQPTNFTNIREDSYVAVRYQRKGDQNIALNVNLIELPLLDPETAPGALRPLARRNPSCREPRAFVRTPPQRAGSRSRSSKRRARWSNRFRPAACAFRACRPRVGPSKHRSVNDRPNLDGGSSMPPIVWAFLDS